MKYAPTYSTILAALLLAAVPAFAESSQGLMYFTETGSNLIKQAGLDGSDVQIVLSALDGVISPDGICVDGENNKLYWTTSQNPVKVQRSSLDGSDVETLVETREDNYADIVLDADGKMHWIRSVTAPLGTVYRANVDGSGVQALLSDSSPTALAIDLQAGKLYWGISPGHFCGGAGKIQRANLDGSGIEDVLTGLGFIISLAIDSKNGSIYWSDYCPPEGSVIKRANLDGSQVEVFLPGILANGLAVEDGSQKLYWTQGVSVRRANLLDGSEVEVLVTFVAGGAVGIALLPAPETDPADLSGDGVVNGIDLALLLGQWGRCPAKGACTADLNGDDVVNGIDLALLLGSWG